jgi:hypothetical protein
VNVPGVTAIFRNLKILNNTFQNAQTTVVQEPGTIAVAGQVRGVISGNTFDRVLYPLRSFGNDSTTEWSNGLFPFSFGSSDNLFFETNTCQFSSSWSGGDPCWMEIGQSSRIVVRFNTANLLNTTASTGQHFDVHGFQNWNGSPNSGETSTMVAEYYRNTLTNVNGGLWVAHRGSWGMYFDNTMTEALTPVGMQANQFQGCGNGDINPDPMGAYIPVINNTYVFNNLSNSARQDMAIGTNDCSIAENTNFWNQQTSFNGTVGVGRGTFAARSATCTIGVGYWATDQGSWNKSGSGGQGLFYKCTSTNNWTLYYTPYVYPYSSLGTNLGTRARLRR